MKYTVAKEPRCPFYHCEQTNSLLCEGLADSSTLHMVFTNPQKKTNYKKTHCNADYNACPIARILKEKY